MRMLILFFLPLAALADDGHGHNHHGDGGDVSVDTIVSSDSSSVLNNSVGGNTSRSYGLGMGDVDIAQCYRSYQVLIWQDSRANYWCMANDLDARGLHEAAARTRCSIKGYRNLFDTRQDCILASTASPLVTVPVPEPTVDEDHLDEEEYHEEQQMLYEDLRAKIENLEGSLQNRPPRVTERVVEQRGLSAEQKAKLREIVDD